MLIRLRNKMGQSTLEYAIVIAVIVAAVLAMQLYFRRGHMGYQRGHADAVGDQFDPGYYGTKTVTQSGKTEEQRFDTGVTKSTVLEDEVTSWSGDETLPEYDKMWQPD